MDISTITMQPAVAKQYFDKYRSSLRARSTDEDRALVKGYKALSEGKRVLDLVIAMRETGTDNLGRPKLAIARADAKKVYYRGDQRGGGRFQLDQWLRSDKATKRYIALPEGTFKMIPRNNITANVPLVPTYLKPKAKLGNYFILWEAEWEDEPPVDPFLLQRLGKYTFIILAQWDLTPLERSLIRK